MKTRAILAAGGALLFAPLAAHAADPNGTPANIAELDLTIPDAPGFAVIDLKPTSVVDPAATRITVADIVSYTDAEGNLKPGFALGTAPYFLLPGRKLEHYRNGSSWPERVFARTQLSLGYAQAAQSKTERVGFGFTTDLLDAGDYRLDQTLYSCVRDAHATYFDIGKDRAYQLNDADLKARAELGHDPAFQKLSKPEQAARINERVAELTSAHDGEALKALMKTAGKDYAAALATCRSDAATRYRNKPSWVVAGGLATRSDHGGYRNPKSDGGSVWTAYRRPLGGEALAEDSGGTPNYLTLFARYDFHRKTDDPAAPQLYDKLTAALVGGYVWSGGAKFSLQAGYQEVNYRTQAPLKDKSGGFYAATFSYPLGAGAWIDLTAGDSKTDPNAPGKRDGRVALSFHYSPPQK